MQVRFRGVLASDDRSDPLLVTELDLGGMSVRSADSDNLNAHGTTSGRDFVADNSVKFVLWSNRKNYQQGVQELNRFLNVWREAIYQSKTGQLIPLEYRHENDGPWQTIFGSPDFSSNSQIDEVAHHGFSQASFEFRQHLPLTYGPERTVDVTDGDYVNFTLSSGPVKPVVTFHGPFTDPTLTLGDMRIGLRGSAPANDYWIVDPYARTITDRYGRNSPARADRLTVLSRIEAEPTGHDVELTSAPRVTIDWRPSAYNKYEGGSMVEYRWLGEPHNSGSVKLVDGVEVARNLAHNPRGAGVSGTVVVVPNYEGTVSPDPDFDLVDGNLVAPAPQSGNAWGDILYYSRTRDAFALRRAPGSSGNMYVNGPGHTSDPGAPTAIAVEVWSETNPEYFMARSYIIDGIVNAHYRPIYGGHRVIVETGTSAGIWVALNVRESYLSPGDTFYFRLRKAVANSEAAALDQIAHYFDGDTPDYIIREDS